MDKTNIIELNGKRYDAVSGILLNDAPAQAVTVAVKPKATEQAKTSARTMDDVIRSPINHTKVHKSAVEPVIADKQMPAHHRTVVTKHKPHHIAVHQPQHAKTLMRTSVKKPDRPLKAVVRVQVPVGHTLSKLTTNLPTKHSDVDAERLGRAQQASKSSAISRFGSSNQNTFMKHVRPLPVQAAPNTATTHTTQSHASSFEAEVARATSHEQAAPHVAKRSHFKSRTVNLFAASAAILFIVGFFAYQNLPNLDVRVASARAGFQATMPGFKPSGFAFSGPVKYNPGEVTIGFRSNSDNRNYNVIERLSNWNSQTLLDSFVSSSDQPYQTVQNAGRTIYLYGSGNATWVNGNVWYRINGNASLSTSQLTDIASST